jgi:hypothetical protein
MAEMDVAYEQLKSKLEAGAGGRNQSVRKQK